MSHVRLYPAIHSAADLRDQWAALEAVAAASAHLGDYEDWQHDWNAWALALARRADMLGLEDAGLLALADVGGRVAGRPW